MPINGIGDGPPGQGSHRYSVAELVALRDKIPVVVCNMDKMSESAGGKVPKPGITGVLLTILLQMS